MSDDFEHRLAELLNASVDTRLGPQRVAPPFAPPADSDDGDEPAVRRRRRYTFLAVAATVAAIVVAAFAVHALAPGDAEQHVVAPVTNPPAPSVKSVQLGGATIALPRGWVARPIADYVPKGVTAGNSPEWCLTPRSTPAGSATIFACPITFTAYKPSMETMDPDSQTGYYSGVDVNQALQCLPHGDQQYREIAGSRRFAGRQAQFRQWTVTCPKEPAKSYVEQQYSVPTAPGYMVTALHSTPRTRAGLATIAAHSTLPEQTGTLRLADRGYVRSATRVGTRTRITIARAIEEPKGKVVREPGESAGYLVPRSALHGPVSRGDLVYLATDGTKVVVAVVQ